MARLLVTLLLVAAVSGASAPAPPAEQPAAGLTSAEVAAAVEKAVAYIESRQAEDGSWPYEKIEHRQGASALAVFALSEAGVTATDPAVSKGLEYVVSQPYRMTYDAACAAMAIASAHPGKYLGSLSKARDFLAGGQNKNGMWNYDASGKGGGDNSNTQFAILGLHAAMSVGLTVPQEPLELAEKHYSSTQNQDGGWAYTPGGASYGAMTAAGAGVMHILGARLYVESDVCGKYRQDPRLAGAIRWLEQNYSVTEHVGGNAAYLTYYLYALERVGVFTGERFFAGHDWYTEGARFLIKTQNPDGSWTSGRDIIPNTCFALLFLAKGNVPVLINKLNYGGAWNVDVHDAENLTRYISAKMGQRVGWQSVTPDESVEALLSAPILYVTGHKFPSLSQQQVAAIRVFFENGGFMLAEACCGSKEFDAGFRAFSKTVFPENPLSILEKTDYTYRAVYDLTGSTRKFEGVQAGCRLNVLYSPEDLSCIWEKNDSKAGEEAFQFGVNIAAYVTGKERLSPRLEQYKPLLSQKLTPAAPGAFTFAQAVYSSGNWNPTPSAGARLLAFLNEKAGLTVSSKQVNIALVDKNLANYPFLYFTGYKRFTLSTEEKAALKEYLERGGFVFADAACGRPEFDESFRLLMQELFPSAPLEAIPADSPVYSIAYDTSRVAYTAAVRELNPGLSTLTLYGVKLDDRVALVYSPYCIGTALEQSPAYGSRGLASDDAFKAAANVVLFALSH